MKLRTHNVDRRLNVLQTNGGSKSNSFSNQTMNDKIMYLKNMKRNDMETQIQRYAKAHASSQSFAGERTLTFYSSEKRILRGAEVERSLARNLEVLQQVVATEVETQTAS